MNDLNTQQIILLCLLVSFVSSIATGITTVSLMNQSPEPVSQTINRVVEKTIERVVETPADDNGTPTERIVETVVVNQEDLTVDAVANNSRSLVRLFNENANGDRTFIGLGIVVNEQGDVVTQSSVTGNGKIIGIFASGEFVLDKKKTEEPFLLYSIPDKGDSAFSPASLSDSQNLKLAQSVILLSGRQSNVVSTGIVNDLDTILSEGSESPIVTSIDAGVDSSKVLIGSILLNLQGEIVGVKIGSGSSDTTIFLPVNNLKPFLSATDN